MNSPLLLPNLGAEEGGDWRRLLRDAAPLDIVNVATYTSVHAEITHAALAAGARVIYCEKPIAKNLDELNRSCDAVKQSGKVVQVGTQLRSTPSMVAAREVYASGLLGTVSRIEQRRNGNQPCWYGYIRNGPPKARRCQYVNGLWL